MANISNSSGIFSGNDLDGGVSEFLGIQFATAERFEEPRDVLIYSDLVVAQNFGDQSPQVPGFMEEILNTKSVPASEDCLYLNIWAPKINDASATKLKPVLFWIHGGAYTNGTAATSWYNGAALVRRGDVVVVSVNYRLGPFGFLGENNLGTLDQISGLRWVQRNIAAFGGDPSNVTIFGESAGGSSVVALTASPLTKGLITKAWAMSPSLKQLRTKNQADVALEQYLSSADCKSIDELRNLSVEQMIEATAKFFVNLDNYISTFTPTRGGAGLPLDIFKASADSGIPLVVGTNHDENRLWTALHPENSTLSIDGAMPYYEKVFDNDAKKAWDLYSRHRENLTASQMVAAFQTDENFRAPAWELCETRSKGNSLSWMYWFTWCTPVFDGAFGSCHGLDLPFMFDNIKASNVELFTGDNPNRQQIADHLSTEVLAFAKSGEVSWPKYEMQNRSTFKIDLETELLTDPEPELRELWTKMR